MTKEEVIQKLDLKPLTFEGRYFRETYRSEFSSAIYYLITTESFSKNHRLSKDEIFHFYLGNTVEMTLESPDKKVQKIKLGQDILKGEQLQVLVPSGHWQESKLVAGGRWALLGTTVSP
jgi:predicted cupin superfamily sugar epimerase